MFKKLKKKFTKYFTRIEVRDVEWFLCEGCKVVQSGKPGRYYIEFPDDLRIIVEENEVDRIYKGFYTQKPYV